MGPRCQEHARPAAGWEGRLSKQDSRPVESITQLISRKTASGKRNFPSHSKKSKKIHGHFRELLMETDGNVCWEVERPRLGEWPPHGETPQRPTGTVCPRDPAEILHLRSSHKPNIYSCPQFSFFSDSAFTSLLLPFLFRMKWQKKNKQKYKRTELQPPWVQRGKAGQ